MLLCLMPEQVHFSCTLFCFENGAGSAGGGGGRLE